MTRVHGELVRHKLGTYPVMTLAQAHEEARRVFRDAQTGSTRRPRRKAAALAAARARKHTFAACAADYMLDRSEGLADEGRVTAQA